MWLMIHPPQQKLVQGVPYFTLPCSNGKPASGGCVKALPPHFLSWWHFCISASNHLSHLTQWYPMLCLPWICIWQASKELNCLSHCIQGYILSSVYYSMCSQSTSRELSQIGHKLHLCFQSAWTPACLCILDCILVEKVHLRQLNWLGWCMFWTCVLRSWNKRNMDEHCLHT